MLGTVWVDGGFELHALTAGAEVAVMPLGTDSKNEVLDILPIINVRAFTIQLANGKLYARKDGRGLVTNEYITAATLLHKMALQSRPHAGHS